MDFLPIVVQAEYRGELKIRIVFNDGVENTIDFSDWLAAPKERRLPEKESLLVLF